MKQKTLFTKLDWSSVEKNQKRAMLEEISTLDKGRILGASITDLCEYFFTKYKINTPVLMEDEIVADQYEVNIDVRHDLTRSVRDRSRPCYVSGTRIEVIVPIEGEADVFKIHPTTYGTSYPFGVIKNQNLVISVEGIDLNPDKVRFQIDQNLSDIKKYLGYVSGDIGNLNDQLYELAEHHINKRKDKVLADHNLVASLGFPLKQRKDNSRTYQTSKVVRKIKPKLPPASTKPYTPEPEISMDDYEHILGVMENMIDVMERSPSAFATMNEEDIRTHFLVQLNGHYEGKATGETFNYKGKTDILIPVNGRNVFIAECKFWSGSKGFLKSIDQLLSYNCWRDSKTALIIFNRRKNLSSVLSSIQKNIEKHENYKKEIDQESETNFRYIFSNNDDIDREIMLTVMVFDVPSEQV